MTTPAEVAGALERLVADAQHNALGALHFASAALDVLTQTIQWSPGDEASVTPSAERCRAWLDTGLASVNEMQKYRRALANVRELETAPPAPLSEPAAAVSSAPAPTDRSTKLKDIATAMVETAANASGDLTVLSDLLQNGTSESGQALAAAMQSFARRSEELQTMFQQAAEVAGCGGSA
jgi:hypothetical protein